MSEHDAKRYGLSYLAECIPCCVPEGGQRANAAAGILELSVKRSRLLWGKGFDDKVVCFSHLFIQFKGGQLWPGRPKGELFEGWLNLLLIFFKRKGCIMEQASNWTTISFLCDPTVYKYVEAAGKALYRPQSQQINFLLQLALELREEDEDVEVFRNWLQKQKEQENQQKEKWLEKELALLKQGLQKHKWS